VSNEDTIQFSDVEVIRLFIKITRIKLLESKTEPESRREFDGTISNWCRKSYQKQKNNFGNMAIIQEIYTDKLMVSWIDSSHPAPVLHSQKKSISIYLF
jgi:hypothetical protein